MATVSTRLLAVAALALAVPSAAAPDKFDQGVDVKPALEAAREAAAADPGRPAAGLVSERPGDQVWISVANADVTALGDEFDFPRRPAASRGSVASVYQVKVSELDILAAIMHRKFRRAPGFFAYASLQAAAQDVSMAPAAAPAREYTIDQGERVPGMLKLVDEASIAKTVTHLSSYKNRYYRAATGVEASRWIAESWKQLMSRRSDASVELFRHSGYDQASVLLTIRGSKEPGKAVVLGSHLDSIAGWGGADAVAPGADDNASGVAVLTEAIRVLAGTGYAPGQTVIFAGFAAEEVGLRGSQDVAADLKRRGLDLQGMANFDMTIYNGSAEDIILISDNTNAAQNAFLGRLVGAYTPYRWGESKCGYGCSDHASFNKNGVAASFPFEAKMNEDNPNIHSANDTLAAGGGNARHAVKFAKLALAYVVELAK